MSLDQELRDYTNLSHANAWRAARAANGIGSVPDEPAFVSSLLSFEMFRGMRSILRKYSSPGTKVLARGIFTHQTPKVKLTSQARSVEIADLMFVHQHFDSDPRKPVAGKALLLQAKNTLKPKTGSLASGTQAIQFELYRDWAPFTGATRLPEYVSGTTPWDFSSGGPSGRQPPAAGSVYFTVFKEEAYSAYASVPQWTAALVKGPANLKLIKNRYPLECTWAVGGAPPAGSAPKAGVQCPDDFGSAFSDFLLGKIGRDFTPGLLSGADHWSVFVNIMLAESGRRGGDYVYNSSNQGIASAVRGRNLGFMSLEIALRHALTAEADEYLEDLANWRTPRHFPFSNHFLSALNEIGRDLPPAENFAPTFQGGHVPILFVVTKGDNPQPFKNFRE